MRQGTQFRVGICALALCTGIFVGCKDDGADTAADSGTDKDSGASAGAAAGHGGNGVQAGDGASAGAGGEPATGNCPPPAPNQPPELLSCTGLYADVASKKVASDVHEFMPAVALWSDGAEKTRWIHLPAGEKIDVSDADAWKFPIGTKLFKEFKWKGKRVETRLFWKLSNFFWARTAYKWNDDESEATRTGGEDLEVNGDAYHIPSTTECDTCHKGRDDRALGFEAILLGLPGATGYNLAKLKSEGLLNGTLPSRIEIGDDGTGKAAAAMGFLHVNCGVSCHNGNSAAEAFKTDLLLRLQVTDADGGSTASVDTRTTTIDVDSVTGRWLGKKRIVAGSAQNSLLYTLMSTRNATNMKDQMPPIASRVVPTEGAALVKAWIEALDDPPASSSEDAGAN